MKKTIRQLVLSLIAVMIPSFGWAAVTASATKDAYTFAVTSKNAPTAVELSNGGTAAWAYVSTVDASNEDLGFMSSGSLANKTNIIAPNANIGNDFTWKVTFKAVSAVTNASGISFGMVMFNGSGGPQTNDSKARQVTFTITDKNGTTLGSVVDYPSVDDGNLDTSTLIKIPFSTAQTFAAEDTITITATEGSNNEGCFYGLDSFTVLLPDVAVTKWSQVDDSGAVTLTVDSAGASLEMDAASATISELTVAGEGVLTFTGANALTATATAVTADTDLSAITASLGTVTVGGGALLTAGAGTQFTGPVAVTFPESATGAVGILRTAQSGVTFTLPEGYDAAFVLYHDGVYTYYPSNVPAPVLYESQVITFSGKTASSINLSGGWSLESLTLSSGTGFMTTADGTVSNDATQFTPNVNIGADGNGSGTWTAVFTAPGEGVVIDSIRLTGPRYTSGGGAQGSNAERSVQITVYDDDGTELCTTGAWRTNGGTFETDAFSFNPIATKSLKIVVTEPDSTGLGCYYGLSQITLGQYTNAEAVYKVIESEFATTEFTRTGTALNTLEMSNGWTFDTASASGFTVFKNGGTSDGAIANLYFAPDVNVGNNGSWAAVFATSSPVMMDKVTIEFCIYDASGNWQGSSTWDTARDFIVSIYDTADTTALDSLTPLATSDAFTITGKGTDSPENGVQTLSFAARSVSNLCIKVMDGTPNTENTDCFIGMKSFTVSHVPLAAADSALVDTPRQNWSVLALDEAVWPTAPGVWGAVYAPGTPLALSGETLPAMQTAHLLRCAGGQISLDGSALTSHVEGTLIAATLLSPEGLTATLTGGTSEARPGTGAYGAMITDEKDLVLDNVAYVAPEGVAVLYAGSSGANASSGWWYSESGAAAVQMSLAEVQNAGAAQGLVWLEGGTLTIDADLAVNLPVTIRADGTANTIAVAEGKMLTFTPMLTPYLTNPMASGDFTVRLGGTLCMAGDLPADLVATSASAKIQLPDAPAATENATTAYMASGNHEVGHPEQTLTLYGAVTGEQESVLTLGDGVVLACETVTAPVTLANADLTVGEASALGTLTVDTSAEVTLLAASTAAGVSATGNLQVSREALTLEAYGILSGSGTVSALTLAAGSSVKASDTAAPSVTELTVADEAFITVSAECGATFLKFGETNAGIANFWAPNGSVYKGADFFYLGLDIGAEDPGVDDAAAAVLITDAVMAQAAEDGVPTPTEMTIQVVSKKTPASTYTDVTVSDALALFTVEPEVVIDGDTATVTVSYDFGVDTIRIVDADDSGYTVEVSATVDGGDYTAACSLEILRGGSVVNATEVTEQRTTGRRTFRVRLPKESVTSSVTTPFHVRATTEPIPESARVD